ncbi:MAG TPA: S9 family peptidase [Longimicrobiales bacterium]
MIRPARGPAVAAGLLLLAACAGTPADDRPHDVRQYSIEEFLGTTNIFGASFSPDGRKILVSSDQTGVYNAFAIPVDGGEPVQLTHSTTDAVMVASYFPADERFIYLSDRGGDELTHVYVQEPDGTVRDITPGEKLKASFLGWADDDESFFIATNERDPRFFDVYEVTVDGYRRSLVYRNDEGLDFAAISPDERYLALVKTNTTRDSDVYLYDRETRELRHLTPHEGQVSNIATDFTPDGAGLLIVTDEGREFAYLVRQDLATGRRDTLVTADWDVMYAGYSKEGSYLVAAINNDARTEIRIYDRDMRLVDLPAPPAGEITAVEFSPDERRIAYYVSSSRLPRDLFVQALDGGAATRLTRSLNPAIAADDLVEGEVVRFASYDGVEIPGILYRPHQASAETPVPALVWVHGGPGGQSRLGYNALIQYLVNHGYAVYAINNRGSSGYGKTFFAMDDRKHGEADLGDVVASKQMLIETGWVDPDRIGIIGGSYGGYMVLAALAFRPQEFAVGVDIFGVANWIRTLESIPPWWESFREALYTEMGDPATDRERLERVSPLLHASNIVKPLIVLQGANDPRVLQVESDEIVAAVRANGVPVEYIVFPDEGHGFTKKANQLRGYEAILRFLDRHLKEVEAAREAA